MKTEHSTIVFYETLEEWKGGKASGYFEPSTNEIHLLKGKALEERALIHEMIHASRREKMTFRFASIIQLPLVKNFLFGVMMLLAVTGLFTSLIPFFFTSGLFAFLIFCMIYEEYKADSLTAQSMKAIKTNGEKT